VTLDKARELLKAQADFGGFYNAHGAKLILAEVNREHGQAAVDALIRELELTRIFGFAPGTVFGRDPTGQTQGNTAKGKP